jgi:hypothetical protein
LKKKNNTFLAQRGASVFRQRNIPGGIGTEREGDTNRPCAASCAVKRIDVVAGCCCDTHMSGKIEKGGRSTNRRVPWCM